MTDVIYYSTHTIKRKIEDKDVRRYCKVRTLTYIDGYGCSLCPWVNVCIWISGLSLSTQGSIVK